MLNIFCKLLFNIPSVYFTATYLYLSAPCLSMKIKSGITGKPPMINFTNFTEDICESLLTSQSCFVALKQLLDVTQPLDVKTVVFTSNN